MYDLKLVTVHADLAKIYTSTYEVQPGDTLLKISMKYKVASKELTNVNNIVNDSIWPNQVLNLLFHHKDTIDRFVYVL